MLSNKSCENITRIDVNGNPVLSTIMFIAGVVGNLVALAILGVHQKERRTKTSVFCILVTGLALTDLLGTCLLSPPVFVCYAQSLSLVGLTGNRWLCELFAFAMTFFGLASMLILCAMAVERCLAISHPYFYSKHVRRSFAKVALFLIYLFTFVFCLLPFFGYGRHKQYCPGTWCFIKMEAEGEGEDEERRTLAFSLSYSVLMALLIAVVFLCNGSVIVTLCRMHRSQLSRRGSVLSAGRKRRMSTWFGQGEEEMDHLVLLASMTFIFVICSLPLTICGFLNAVSPVGNDQQNLAAFRFHASNPILDPWIFIIFRKTVFKHLRSFFRCRFPKDAVKSTAQNALSVPLEVGDTSNSTAIQSKIYCTLPQ
ncbi:prostacyclin receptor [Misgurnus anguillicaudatus]|uniref:prostacyclin receptor n=1 Tax=Misgurnus anguillicaudatus TaxID=75329 RepID=UPI0024360FFE|nr:prostacyclin receptor [Misgurnus anguillicaudatus]XP_055051967.1 prostacyclin receptor [Misgurnus anguillicaudatus]